jgi:hypothetical protein
MGLQGLLQEQIYLASVAITDVPYEIRTENFPSTSQEHKRYYNLRSATTVFIRVQHPLQALYNLCSS